MTNYVNWMQYSQQIKGDVLQTQGNPVANHESPATGVASGAAPQGAQYAYVWADVATQVQATNLNTNLGSGLTVTIPANTILEIPNIKVGETTIEMTDL